MRALPACVLLLVGAPATCIETADVRALAVTVEHLSDPVQVDGVSLHIARATGPGVGELAERVQRRWRREGSDVRNLAQPGWEVRARWRNGHSELIQWRGAGATTELLHSQVDITRSPGHRAPPPFQLPSGCAWGRTIEGVADGRHYVQRTALCRTSASKVLRVLAQHLRARRWTITASDANSLHVVRSSLAGVVSVMQRDSGSAMVWLGTEPPA